jgi:hypothetical protein
MSKIVRTISRSEHDYEQIEVEDESMDRCLEVYEHLRNETSVKVDKYTRVER